MSSGTSENDVSKIEDRDYFVFVEEKAREVDKERECFRAILSDLNPCDHVWEAFGGIGLLHQLLVKEFGWTPQYQTWEHSARCVEYLQGLDPSMEVTLGDSFQMEIPLARPNALFSLDFNTFTPLRAERDAKYLDLVTRVCAAQPRWLQVTDSAVNRLHLNFGPYTQLFGRPITDLPSYLKSVSRWFYDRFGYSVRKAAYHHGASYLLLSREPATNFKVVKP